MELNQRIINYRYRGFVTKLKEKKYLCYNML